MIFFKKPIFTGFAPNLTKADLILSLKYLFLPWYWNSTQQGDWNTKAEKYLENYLSIRQAITFDSGRSALYFLLQALGSKSGDEVLVQAYTCMVVINAIRWTGATPVFVDVDNDFNMDSKDLKRKITSKTKIIIIQHTFGKPANLEELLKIAKENNLRVVEDCAHSLGAKHNGRYLGSFGDGSILSFGPDKIVSCIRGGAVITNNEELGIKLKQIQIQLPNTPTRKVIQHLLYYPIFFVCKPLYNLFIGKLILKIAKTLKFYGRIIYNEEKLGLPVTAYPAKLPNCLAQVLCQQLDNLNQNLNHRRNIAKYYHNNFINKYFTKPEWSDDSVWLRYTCLVGNPTKIHQFTRKQGVILGNWYDAPIAPKDIDLSASGYVIGNCPNDEKLARMSINLPTDPTVSLIDVKRIVDLLNSYV